MIVVLQMPLTHWAGGMTVTRVAALGILLIRNQLRGAPHTFGRGARFPHRHRRCGPSGDAHHPDLVHPDPASARRNTRPAGSPGYPTASPSPWALTIGPAVGSQLLQGWGGLGPGAVAGLSLAMAALMLRGSPGPRGRGA